MVSAIVNGDRYDSDNFSLVPICVSQRRAAPRQVIILLLCVFALRSPQVLTSYCVAIRQPWQR